MKKTSENVGVKGETKIDYFKLRKETPAHLRKRITIKEFREMVVKTRQEKLKDESSTEVQK